MPWCETCSRFYNPNSLRPDGSCPECGRHVADPPDPAVEGAAGAEGAEAAEKKKAPWHFKLLLAVLVVYLTYRFIQIGVWIFDWATH